jgi:hypothetical protein
VLLLCLARGTAAQGPAGHEFGIQTVSALADPVFVGGGISFGLRPEGRTRLLSTVSVGSRSGRFAARGELLLQYLIDPARWRGWGLYGLGGIAGVTGRSGAGYVVLGIGVETAPGGKSGWMVEGGVGGGVRVALGWRRRWLHRPQRMP